MNLLQHFKEASEDGLVRFTLKEEERQEFLESLTSDFHLNYISKKELKQKALANEMNESDFFEQFLIPEVPAYANVRSGDFGEMLCFLLLKDKSIKKGRKIVGPRKWRWKSDKNKPCHGTDVVTFHKHQREPSNEDFIESVESKMKATIGPSSPIQNAIDGAKDDKVKRLAKSLNWIHDMLAKEGKPRLREAINRYRFVDENPTYQKKFHAIAIIDDKFVADEIAKNRTLDEDIVITVVSLKQLKTAYETSYEEMVNILE